MKTKFAAAFLTLVLLAACEVGPDYERPSAPTSETYKEAGNWVPAAPKDDINRGPWWMVFNDPMLDLLERQVTVSNQNLIAAEAAYRQARALTDEARVGLFPTVSVGSSYQRSGTGQPHTIAANAYNLSADATWVPDIWGRIRRTIEQNEALAQASAADLASATLSAQALLATDYFDLRVQDETKALLDATVLADRKALEIIQNQFDQGIVSKADVLQAETLLQSVRAQAVNTGVRRAQLEHAIAVLIGKPPAVFAIATSTQMTGIPAIPVAMPSQLLERRPDIASAERQMAAANAVIGIQVSAYYPDITLSASAGFASIALGNLVSAPSFLWSFGPALSETVFDAGARAAAVEAARAGYDQAVANYRQTVLSAFQQVEDNLSTLRVLAQQAVIEDQTVASSRQAEGLVFNQYKAGIVPYSSVLTAQTSTLNSEQTTLSVYQTRLEASVGLIQALGGGWSMAQLPKD